MSENKINRIKEYCKENIKEKLIDNSFYNMKISSRDELIALFMKMQKVKQVICLKFKT